MLEDSLLAAVLVQATFVGRLSAHSTSRNHLAEESQQPVGNPAVRGLTYGT